jgi:hypothetical protein
MMGTRRPREGAHQAVIPTLGPQIGWHARRPAHEHNR